MHLNWFVLSVIALTSLSAMSFLITFLTRKGIPVSFVLLAIGIIFTIFYFYHSFFVLHYKMQTSLVTFGILIVIGALSVIGNMALFQAANDAPNPGLAVAIGAGLQSGLVALLAFVILKDKLSGLQIAGLILSIIAILFITLGENKSSKSISAEKEPKKISTSK